MTKVTIIGAGNMGSAMAKVLCRESLDMAVRVANPSVGKLERLKEEFPGISTFTDNAESITGADVIILAVKPWVLPEVVAQIAPHLDSEHQLIVSVAGGVDIESLTKMFGASCRNTDMRGLKLFRAIPNTAIALGKGMTFVSHNHRGDAGADLVRTIFSYMGEVGEIDERLMDAATALSSCGIAYVFKAVQAAVQAGVQLGFRPAEALRYVNATVSGASALLQAEGATPQTEIDKVTTPGGMTIKGINSLEHDGFASAIINAILAPLKK